ncbi:MAG: response regulator [Ignavibacteria bacterium]|jgi:PAS domain S-box-containing protein
MKERIKILHLEDNDADAELICYMLEQGEIDADIHQANGKESFLSKLEETNYDLIISDYSIPQFDGLKALVKAKEKNKNIPFIFCSGTIGEERAVQCLQLGAMDYVIKDRMDRLVPAVNRALRLITEIKKKEKAEAELSQIRLAVENTSETIFVTDANYVLQYINPSFTKMYGWLPEEIIGKQTPNILKSNKHDEIFYKKLKKLLKEGKPFTLEVSNKTKDGKHVEIKNMINPIINSNIIIGYVCVQTDITLKKLQELELMRAKHEAEEMSKLKSYFLSNISHEMRTPLISILGFSEILKDELMNEKHINYINHIYESGTRLKNTISSILSLHNLENEKQEINNTKLDLLMFLEKITKRFRRDADKKGLSLNTSINCKEAWSNTDQELLSKVLTNVLDNAIKFTHKGSVTMSLSTETDHDSYYAIIKIIDTGVGIPDDKLNNLFVPFRQVSEGLDRAYEGMGLGLYIAKHTLELLHGKIQIHSKIQSGTQVQITLPILPFENEIEKKIDMRKTTIEETDPDVQSDKPNVLLVEDNESNRMIFNRFLNNDFIVDSAEDGISAISKAELKQYDLILMDINLGPGIDGIETFHRISKLPNYTNVPVIAVTAYAMKHDKQKFLEHGFTDYIQKPVMKDELISLIKSHNVF